MMANKGSVLRSSGGEQVALQSVSAVGRISGLLFEMTVRQHYCNTSQRTIETVYTLPLAWGAVLMGMSVEIGGKRQTGAVIEKKQAQDKYEDAIAEGDMPIMLERSSTDLYTINLGNLKSSEKAVIEYRYAQLLRFEDDCVRLSIPTTIAPRYGDEQAQGGLKPHESTDASMLVEYPFDLSISIDGQLASGTIDSPSHAIKVARTEMGLVATLARNGYLDRDFVLTVDTLKSAAISTVVKDEDGYIALASFCPSIQGESREPIALKILVDCSGSMQGDSIHSAKRALHQVLAELNSADRFCYSRFGSRIAHGFGSMRTADPITIRVASVLVEKTEADLGGTEIETALRSTFALADETQGADLLLITDGEVWNIEEIIKIANQSGHRIFAIGVGSAPSESLLRLLAESTGGACELLAPSENIEQSIIRMFRRIRLPRAIELNVNWGGAAPIWETNLPSALFDGKTVHVFACFEKQPTEAPVLSFLMQKGKDRIQAIAPVPELSDAQTFCRLAVSERLKTATKEDALESALRYQLVTQNTNLFLVHERAAGDKATDLPHLQKVAQMLAAGWGGTGTIERSINYSEMDMPTIMRTGRQRDAVEAMKQTGSGTLDVPSFLRKQADTGTRHVSKPKPPVSIRPTEVLKIVNQNLNHPDDLAHVIALLESTTRPDSVEQLMVDAPIIGADAAQAWIALILWLSSQLGTENNWGRHAARSVTTLADKMDKTMLNKLLRMVSEEFGTVTLEFWNKDEADSAKYLGGSKVNNWLLSLRGKF